MTLRPTRDPAATIHTSAARKTRAWAAIVALIAITACTWDDYDGQDTLAVRGDLSGKPLPGAFKSIDSVALADENVVAMVAVLNAGSILIHGARHES